jgi:hypothetical protein
VGPLHQRVDGGGGGRGGAGLTVGRKELIGEWRMVREGTVRNGSFMFYWSQEDFVDWDLEHIFFLVNEKIVRLTPFLAHSIWTEFQTRSQVSGSSLKLSLSFFLRLCVI